MVRGRRLGGLGWSAVGALAVSLLGEPAVVGGGLRVEWTSERLSVAADGEPLGQVVLEVARRAGVDAPGAEGLREAVAVRFSQLTLREGLARLLVHVSHVLVEDPVPGGPPRVTRVLVFRGDRRSGRAAVHPTIEPGAEAEQEDGEASIAMEGVSTVGTTAPADIVERPNDEPEPESDQGQQLLALQAAAERGDDKFLREALDTADDVVAGSAFKLLAQTDAHGAIQALDERTASGRSATRLMAVQFLHQTRWESGETVLAALDRALVDSDIAVKTYAVQALATRGGPMAWASLSWALRDPDPAVRLAVVESAALSEEGWVLLNQALSDPDESVRVRADFWLKQSSEKSR
jgi:hypothetical protein